MNGCGIVHMGSIVGSKGTKGLRDIPQPLGRIGAADRIRTGDVQLGKLAFCH
jgi:hypothetical protein